MCFGYQATASGLSALLTVRHGKRGALFKLASNFVQGDKMKTKLIRWYMRQFLKVLKEKQNGALQSLKVGKVYKDEGVLCFNYKHAVNSDHILNV